MSTLSQSSLAFHTPGRAGGDLVSSLSRLTEDVERFESMIQNLRELVKRQATDFGAYDDEQLLRESNRLTTSAAEIVTKARGALAELDGLSSENTEGPKER